MNRVLAHGSAGDVRDIYRILHCGYDVPHAAARVVDDRHVKKSGEGLHGRGEGIKRGLVRTNSRNQADRIVDDAITGDGAGADKGFDGGGG